MNAEWWAIVLALFGVMFLVRLFLVSPFQVFRDKPTSEPELIGHIDGVVSGAKDGTLDFFLNMAVSNRGADSVADYYQCFLTIDGARYALDLHVIPDGTKLAEFGKELNSSDHLPDKTAVDPIKKGGRARGWLSGRPHDHDSSILTREYAQNAMRRGGVIFEVLFKDVNDKQYRVTFTPSGPGSRDQLRYYPDRTGGK